MKILVWTTLKIKTLSFSCWCSHFGENFHRKSNLFWTY